MTGLHQGWLVARRELRERSRSPTFRVSLLIMAVMVAVLIVVPSVLKPSTIKDVGITGSTPTGLVDAIKAQGQAVGITTPIHRFADLRAGQDAVRQRKVSVLVVDSGRLEWPRAIDQQLQAVVTGAIQLQVIQQRALAAGITPQTLGKVLDPVPVRNTVLGSVLGRTPADESAAIVMSGLMLLVISIYGGLVLGGVVEEKSSRVVEVLLARIKARILLAGKIAGIGLLGLAQVAVMALIALIAIGAVGSFNIPAVRPTVLGWLVIWFIIGYALYATMYGALGALASRPEDAQSVAGPAMAVMAASYFAAFIMIRQPYSAFARVISYIPFSAPIAMPNRIAMGATAWWEPFVAVAIALATTAGLVVFGGRLYEGAILHGGPALGLREALRRITPTRGAGTEQARTHARLARVHNPWTRRTAMAKTHHSVSPRTTAEFFGIGIALGILVGFLTTDVILGVIAGAGFIGCATLIARAWLGHGGGGQYASHS